MEQTAGLLLYISCSLDGFIAKPNDDLSFLDKMQVAGEDYGYGEFMDTIDVVIVGRRTYDWVIGQGYAFPHEDKETYVITRSARPKQGNITFYDRDLEELVHRLKGKRIFCDGGSQIVNQLLRKRLFDELIISIVPAVLGEGIPLFERGIPEMELSLISCKSFESGLIQTHYHAHR